MINRKELKAKAKQFAFNNKWNYWKPQLIYMLFSVFLAVIAGIVVYALGYELTDQLEESITTFIEILLTPMAVDASRPFPLILNKSVNIAVLMQMEDELNW